MAQTCSLGTPFLQLCCSLPPPTGWRALLALLSYTAPLLPIIIQTQQTQNRGRKGLLWSVQAAEHFPGQGRPVSYGCLGCRNSSADPVTDSCLFYSRCLLLNLKLLIVQSHGFPSISIHVHSVCALVISAFRFLSPFPLPHP